jgi:hypothetical protein
LSETIPLEGRNATIFYYNKFRFHLQ